MITKAATAAKVVVFFCIRFIVVWVCLGVNRVIDVFLLWLIAYANDGAEGAV